MSPRYPLRVVAIATALAFLVPAPRPALAQRGQPVAAPTADELTRAADRILTARSRREAKDHIQTLKRGGDAGWAHLEELATEPRGLHPEVKYLVCYESLVTMHPGALELARRFLGHRDDSLRQNAAKTLAKASNDTTEMMGELLQAIKDEDDPTTRRFQLIAIARAKGGEKEIAYLESLVLRDQNPEVLLGAAAALSGMGSSGSAPKVLASLHADMQRIDLARIFTQVHDMLGRPDDPDRLLAALDDPTGDLYLWGLNRVRYADNPQWLRDRKNVARMHALARSGLDHADPLYRQEAVLGLSAEHGIYTFSTNIERIQLLVEMLGDPSPAVRLAVLNGLHNTAMRRGIMAPGVQPLPLEPHTMRMLRYPTDWTIFPAYVKALSDSDLAVRERVCWMLGISTGYWHGYSDIRLQGKVQVSPRVRAKYRQMVTEMQEYDDAETYVRSTVENIVTTMSEGKSESMHAAWMRGMRLLTGRTFGWSANADVETREAAVARLAEWFESNGSEHPAAWVIATVQENGVETIEPYTLATLSRWGFEPLPRAVVYSKMDPEEGLRRLNEWWLSVRKKLDS